MIGFGMDFGYALLSEAAQITSDGRVNVLGLDVSTLFAQGPPPWIVPSLHLLATIRFSPSECQQRYRIVGDMIAPDGSVLPPHIEQDLEPPMPSEQDLVWRLLIAAQVTNVSFPVFGIYHFRLSVRNSSGETLLEKQIRLRLAEPPTATPTQSPSS